MTSTALPFRATLDETCAWLALQISGEWNLARLIEQGLIPYVWLDYSADYPELFGDANGGYPAPIYFAGDTARLAAGSPDVLITMTKDADKIATHLPPPGLRRELHELRFLKKEIEKLAAKIKKDAEPKKVEVESAAESHESRNGINKNEVFTAFAPLLKIDLAKALDGGLGIFGEDGARVKGHARKAKNKQLWNPVTLALGLNDNYRVPISALKKAFATHEFLYDWQGNWQSSVELLGLR